MMFARQYPQKISIIRYDFINFLPLTKTTNDGITFFQPFAFKHRNVYIWHFFIIQMNIRLLRQIDKSTLRILSINYHLTLYGLGWEQ